MFGAIRIEGTEKEPLFCASDVCRALGFSNPWKAVGDHVDDDDLTKAQAELWFEKELNIRKEAFITKYSLVIDLWRAKWKYENAKVSFIKREITSKEFIAAMGDTEEKIHDISNKIAIADFELKKLYERKQ